jgi:small subunit ribosomal protein S6
VKDYEAVYIFDSALEETTVNEKLDRFHGLIAGDHGGQVTAVDHWGRRQLAYPIEDHENGYYVVTHFNAVADTLPEFERLLKLDDALLRYLIVVNEGNLGTSPAPIVEERDPDAEDGDSDDEEA